MSSATVAPAGPPPVPAYPAYPQCYPAKFVAFHDRAPWAYEGIVARARELKARGFRGVGVRYLFEDLRYSKEAAQHAADMPGVEFLLDNNLTPWFGRLIESREKDLRGFFRLRRTEEEIAAADTQESIAFPPEPSPQVPMEFD